MAPSPSRPRPALFDSQAEADEVAEIFGRMVDALDRLRALDVPVDWLTLCLQDAAADAQGHLEARGDGEPLDWRAIEDVLAPLEERRTGNVVQLRLL